MGYRLLVIVGRGPFELRIENWLPQVLAGSQYSSNPVRSAGVWWEGELCLEVTTSKRRIRYCFPGRQILAQWGKEQVPSWKTCF